MRVLTPGKWDTSDGNDVYVFGARTGAWKRPCEDDEARIAGYRPVESCYVSVGQTTRILDGLIDGSG